MSTSTITPAPTAADPTTTSTAKKTFLEKVGHDLAEIFHFTEEAAVVGEPIVQKVAPNIAPIYVLGLQTAFAVQTTFSAANNTSATLDQKVAMAMTAAGPQLIALFQKAGIQVDQTGVEKWYAALQSSLEALEATTQPASPTPAA